MARDMDNLAGRVAELESLVARLEARLADQDRRLAVQAKEMVLKDGVLIDQVERIVELERALEDAHGRSKRQTAPFSKGEARPEPKRTGRKRGDAHGRHGHRSAQRTGSSRRSSLKWAQESTKPERHNRPEGSRAHFPQLLL